MCIRDSPVQAFGDFVKENLRGLASAGGVAYHNITGDMEGVNYSSARVAELKEREMWKMLQCWYADNVKTLIFEKWLTSALAMGAIKTDRGRVLRLSDNDALNKPQWFGRRWSWVDPQKETQAAILQIENGLSSPARVLAERCLLYTSPSPRDRTRSRMPSSA